MGKKKVFKVMLKLFFTILIVLLVITSIKYRNKVDETTLKFDVPIMQMSKMTILSSNSEPICLDNIDVVILYNIVHVPLNEIFSAIFDAEYTANINQTLEYGSTKLVIDLEGNTITIPNYYDYSDQRMNNTVVVEIE